MKKQGLWAAAAQKDITPPLGTLINGEFQSRYANRIHDNLYAKALVLKDSKVTLIFVVVDICAMQAEFLDDVKEAIKENTGVPKEAVLISSTHTHSAGAVVDLLMGHADLAYRRKLKADILNLVVEACSDLRPAKIAFGAVDAPEYVLCRRYKMQPSYSAVSPVTHALDRIKTNPFGDEGDIVEANAKPDTEVGYLAVKGLDDRWVSILANYSLHYVGDADRGTITADYFGCFARELQENLRDDGFVAIMSNGTSGDVNIWDFQNTDRFTTENHLKSEHIGGDLARKVFDNLDKLEWEEDATLDFRYEELPIATRKPTTDELQRAKDIVQATDYEQVVLDEHGYQQVYAREQLLLAEYPDYVNFYVQSFRVGSGLIGGLGGEFFAETGLDLKTSVQTDKYFTICFANDYVGYVPPEHELELGGYETWRCRTSFLENKAEEKIKGVLLRQIGGHIGV